ncbi:MAG: hypothetical protein M3441_02390 [Chloroflexota bacterium]|nr:hypothetical protein [Chloroflexota bacterium]
MPGKEQLRKNLDKLNRMRDTVESSLKHVDEIARGKKAGRRNVNIATRVNKAATINTGEPNTAQGASSRQHVRIKQTPGGTEEVYESTDVHVSGPRQT